MHAALLPFFNGVHDKVVAAFTASAALSNETKGAMRETGLRDALQLSIPLIARVTSGDVIDATGNRTGQLDGVVVHQSSPILQLSTENEAIILAEGVVGVIEAKSDLSKQWSQVERTWEKLKPIRRPYPAVTYGGFDPTAVVLPFYAIGLTAWATPGEALKRVQALRKDFGVLAPPVVLATFNPPTLVGEVPDGRGGAVPWDLSWPKEERGQVIARIWADMSIRARAMIVSAIDWQPYLN
jgi:hypothetical protein